MDCFPHVQEVPMSWDDGAFTPHFPPENILYQFPIRFYLTQHDGGIQALFPILVQSITFVQLEPCGCA